MAGERHWIIHGAALHFSEGGLVELVRHRLKERHAIESHKITIKQIDEFYTRSLVLAGNLNLFAAFWLRKTTPDELHKVLRESGIELP
jgi:hypothetical protein